MEKMIAWVEIPTIDFERAVSFYEKLLGTDLTSEVYGTEKMACLPSGEGAIINAPGFEPSNQGVVVSLNVGDNLDEVLSRLELNGGEIIKPKTKIEASGRDCFALFLDTEGNRLGLYGN
ncbi:VOC family protein [Marinilabilia rubra]|uniref:Glyoxalase n=1 Tax=Marinilabilia rubra TaxID=2162893 RepID=A0A2U2BC60_9BACT|nr:VOC family protein [Marinilabilia rubra]PWE00656.1 glyoxalase [Marinilabilia rubra]